MRIVQVFLILFLLGALTYQTVIPRVTPIVTHVPKSYRISLDDPPIVQWKQAVEDYKEPLKKFLDTFDMLPIPQSFFNGVQWYARNVYAHQDFVANIDAIAKLSGLPF